MRLKLAAASSHSATAAGSAPAGSRSTLVPTSMMGLLPAQAVQPARVSTNQKIRGAALGGTAGSSKTFAGRHTAGLRTFPLLKLTHEVAHAPQDAAAGIQQVHQQHHQRLLLLHHPAAGRAGEGAGRAGRAGRGGWALVAWHTAAGEGAASHQCARRGSGSGGGSTAVHRNTAQQRQGCQEAHPG